MVNFQRKFADLQYFRVPQDYPYNSFPNNMPQLTAYNFYHPFQTPGVDTAQQNNYSAYRYDTYHEFAFRASTSTSSPSPRGSADASPITPTPTRTSPTSTATATPPPTRSRIPRARLAGDIGLSGDFKISRTWLDAKAPALGINGIRHEIEPSSTRSTHPPPTVSPNDIRGFDNRLYSTQLQPLDWTEYNSIDSIDPPGRRPLRRLEQNPDQARRRERRPRHAPDYADADFDHNFSAATPDGTFSNVFNNLNFAITPQLTFQAQTPSPSTGRSYNEIENNIIWSPDPSLQFIVGEHYLNHSSIFENGNQATLDLFYRINEHWQIEAQEQFEADTGHLQLQQYTIYRDLDAWQLGMTYSDSELNGVQRPQRLLLPDAEGVPQVPAPHSAAIGAIAGTGSART